MKEGCISGVEDGSVHQQDNAVHITAHISQPSPRIDRVLLFVSDLGFCHTISLFFLLSPPDLIIFSFFLYSFFL